MLRIGETDLFDEHVPIPSESGMIAPTVVAPKAYPRGTPVYFHLHNHGQNTWNLLELRRGDCE